MNSLAYDETKPELDISHVEQKIDKESADFSPASAGGLHVPQTLAELPMAPSLDMLQRSVALSEASKVEPVRQAFRNEYKAVLFCLVYILAAVGQGLDSGASSITYNMPAFKLKFGGFDVATKSLILPSLWLALWNASSSIGNALGSLGTGAITDRFGYRTSQFMGCAFSIAAVALQVFAQNKLMVFFGKLLNGISQGLFVAISAGYISEVAGPRTRATMMSALGASIIVGIVAGVGIGSNAKIIGDLRDWHSWRLMYAVQWIVPALCMILLPFTPESPVSCVKRGSPESALKSIRRLRKMDTEDEALVRLAAVQLAVAASIEDAKSNSATYADCFKGTDLKRTLTVMALFAGVQFGGVAFLSNGLYFLAQTGLDFSIVSDISLGFLALSALLCVATSFLLEKLGRRNILVWGSVGHAALLTLVGALHYAGGTKAGLIATAMLFNLGVSTAQVANGAPVFALSIEISSVRLRSKTQSLGFASYYVFGWIFLFAVPYMYQAPPEGANWGVRTCWFFGGLTFLFALWSFFWVGETKGRSYADIDEMYTRKISPRKFATMDINAERDALS